MRDELNSRTTLDTPISGDRGRNLAEDLRHHDSRLAIREVVEEHIGSSDFSKRVKDIQSEHLESTETYKKISDKVQSQIDGTLNDRNLKTWTVVLPNIVAVIATAIAALAWLLPRGGA